MLTNSSLFTPIKMDRAFERISGQIKELIFAGTFKPGDKLPSERDLALQFKAGRMVVREALRVLEQSGLIYIRQGSEGGAFVKNVDTLVVSRSISDMIRMGSVRLQDLAEARLGIEKMILETAIERIEKVDLDLIERNLQECEEMIRRGVIAREGNIEFHILLAKASKNPIYLMIEESIMKLVFFFLKQLKTDSDYSKRILVDHKEIFLAIKEGDKILAKKKMEDHLTGLAAQFSEIAQNIGSVQSPIGDLQLHLK